MFHGTIFTPILECPKEFVFQRNTAGAPAKLMPLGIGNSDNSKQLKKRCLGHAKKLFELVITLVKGFGNFGRMHKEKNR
jgi:hypothetical protein